MYNQTDGKPYLITGGIWETYWTGGGCDVFGVPVGEQQQIGFAKNLDKIGDITKTIKQATKLEDTTKALQNTYELLKHASKRKFLAAREALVRIDGIGLELAFDGNGYVNYSDFTNKINELPYLEARKVVDAVSDLTPNEKAYNLIKAANGGSTKVLQYTYKNGKIVWLEEGIAKGDSFVDYGLNHIWDKHHFLGDELVGSGSKFPATYTKEDIKKVIFEVVKEGERLPHNPNHPGKYAMKKIIDFGDGQQETVLVAIEDSGKILSAYPLKDIK